ncbi:DUF1338 domain-containing protein [Celerinatantimonas diazotrophica]|uniref:2-oxoadipate dioxygenase/decarboxylase n=1 Tax=Celerinatantimonas diazotrophica TaxID=412034 RepID=A0A4V2PR76_9GAMM|nr:uncharacterized protein DUF1338 [Celerinatantimonas diazotrophica]CAG9298227.1 hypothetical protein CEDIAZO_03422 [Celerinatantimonas diazotrophica]
MKIDALFAKLWLQYLEVTPCAKPIQKLLCDEGEVINDHVAFRTYALPDIRLEDLARHFTALGYRYKDEYQFKLKKLRARYLLHPDPKVPKVFISELKVDELSSSAQRIIGQLYQQLPTGYMKECKALYSGRPWHLSYQDYQTLLSESEYAAWLAAFGYRANHFTVSVNALKSFNTLEDVNDVLMENGYQLNLSGGLIKGSRSDMLEQSSTLAEHVCVNFIDQKELIPSCFYEFALRYPDASGKLYQGFVEASADKIFDSTNMRATG